MITLINYIVAKERTIVGIFDQQLASILLANIDSMNHNSMNYNKTIIKSGYDKILSLISALIAIS